MVGSKLLEGKKDKKDDIHTSLASAKDGATDSTKRRKKKTRHHKASGDPIELSASRDEILVFEDGAVVDNNETKKRKRMLKFDNQRKEDSGKSRKKGELKGNNGEVGEAKHRKKNVKEKESKEKANSVSYAVGNHADNRSTKAVEELQQANEKEISGIYSKEGGNEKRKKKKGSKRLLKITKNALETGLSEKSTSKSGSKRVSFSDDVEVFPSLDDSTDGDAVQDGGLVRGKRFSPEEDEKVKEAVLNYINSHKLGEEGLEMVMNCKKHPEVKNCWKEIAAALPHRPSESIYYRAHILFLRDENRKWTQEEYEIVQKYYEKHGPDWKTLADALGKHRFHVKEAWRRIRLPNAKKGAWSQEEYQSLFDLVNKDLRMKAFEEERKSKHGMLRDNISWMAISNKLETRTDALCCMKWYDQLTSPMVAEGEWSDTDDYRLLIELYNQDAFCMEDVEWDNLLEHRSGDICRKRWNQMVKHLGEHASKSFSDQIEVLMNRYCPDVLEAREAYDGRPIVP